MGLIVFLHLSVCQVTAAGIVWPDPCEAKERYTETELQAVYEAAQARYGSLLDDDTATYDFDAIGISGNRQITSEELLRQLPIVYAPEVLKDEERVRQAFDFRPLHRIQNHGQRHPVSRKTMEGLTRYLLHVYQQHGYAGIYVYVRSESIRRVSARGSQTLLLRVLEGKIASVTVSRHDFAGKAREEAVLREGLFEAWSPIKVGGMMHKKKVDDFVRLMNRNPDRQVRVMVSNADDPDDPNALALQYNLYENDPWHYYAQVDSSGVDERQWNPRVGLLHTNLTGRDDTLSVMGQMSLEDPDKNYAAFGAYDLPVGGPRLRIGAYGGYSEYKITPEATKGLIQFLGNGYFGGGILRYHLGQSDGWMVDALATLSGEKSDTNPSLGTHSDVSMLMLGLGLDVSRRHEKNYAALGVSLQYNLAGSDTEAFNNARTNAEPRFTRYLTSARFHRTLDDSKVHQIRSRFMGVMADRRLVPAKMTTFGGIHSVRGYKEDEIVADGGVLASLEYGFNLSRHLDFDLPQDQASAKRFNFDPWDIHTYDISLIGFTDYGRAYNKQPVTGELGVRDHMSSVGIGAEIEGGRNLSIRTYLGWALSTTRTGSGQSDTTLTAAGRARWSFSFLLRY